MEAILTAIQSGVIKNVKPTVVISDKKDAIGLEIASNKFGIPVKVVLQKGIKGWLYDSQIVTVLQNFGVDPDSGLICLAGFMRILSPEFVGRYRMRIINIHPSLLPAFPGLHAQKKAIEYGVKVSGCTVHFVNDGVDSGPIILQQAVRVLNNDNEETLSARILQQEHQIYPQAVKLFAEGKIIVVDRHVSITK
jgi:phosphoribosylglycinamide formyltransferase-1